MTATNGTADRGRAMFLIAHLLLAAAALAVGPVTFLGILCLLWAATRRWFWIALFCIWPGIPYLVLVYAFTFSLIR